MLGIIIGVGAVIVIMSVGAGAQSLILSQIKSLGSNLIGVLPGKSDKNQPPASVLGITITTLTYDDARAMLDKSRFPHIISNVAYTKGYGTLSWNANTYETNLSGSTVGYLQTENGEVAEGRFFTEDEERNLSRYVVLGSTVKNELFAESNAVGQRIKINKKSFEVIGVMKERGTVAFQNYDDQVFIPILTMQKLVAGVDNLGLIRVKLDDQNNIDSTIEDVTQLLRERHGINDSSGDSDDFTVLNAAEALDLLKTITNALRYFLAAIAALSLVVGGIGIMNIMLVAVSERTREIGLRKAVGATNSNIQIQFLLEAVIITFLGGIIGIIGGSVLSFLIATIAQALGYAWEFSISLSSVLLAVFVSISIGIIFGLFPAIKASRLNPIEALRYE
ncbi:FtsX-like permease family protein [Candidatus Falkowbacteria bacterium]|nr:FtsX-like permease family protein [Candidatus Falkowbacteria bacterium]